MKKVVIALFMLLIGVTGAYAESKPAAADIYHDWFMYYYFAPDPAKIPDFLKWLQANDSQDTYTTVTPAIDKGFLSAIFAANPDKVDGWIHSADFSGRTKSVLEYAAKPPVSSENLQIKNLADIDMTWGAFYATGKELYLKKIVDVLDSATPLDEDKTKADETRTIAALSLGSNMTQHEVVERYLTAESEKRNGPVGDALKKIIGDVRAQREKLSFKHKEGDFSAVMFVTDPAVAAKEFSSAASGELHMKEMAHAKVGDKRTIVILFAGQELTPDLTSDVTYDAQIIDPAGKVYVDKRSLVGVQGKLPSRFRVYFNKEAMFIAFDSKDTKGVYQINVTLHDNIGKKVIPLSGEITFKK